MRDGNAKREHVDGKPVVGNDYYRNTLLWAVPAAVLQVGWWTG